MDFILMEGARLTSSGTKSFLFTPAADMTPAGVHFPTDLNQTEPGPGIERERKLHPFTPLFPDSLQSFIISEATLVVKICPQTESIAFSQSLRQKYYSERTK